MMNNEKELTEDEKDAKFVERVKTHGRKGMTSRPNRFAKKAQNLAKKKVETKPVSMRIRLDVLAYYETLSEENGIPTQTLMNSYLVKCMNNKEKVWGT